MLNQFTGMGRLTKDPEIRYTQTQTAVASFTLAIERDYKDGNGQKETDFIDFVAWRNTAEFVSKYFKKVDLMCATGRLQVREWTDKEGNKRRSYEIITDQVYFGAKNNSNGATQSAAQSPVMTEIGEEDGQLPF